jgi:hypothetical protein
MIFLHDKLILIPRETVLENVIDFLYNLHLVRLGGVVVSVIATGPRGCGFEPGQGDEFLRACKRTVEVLRGWI